MLDDRQRRDPSPLHPLRLDALERVVEHAGARRTLLEWWQDAAYGRVDDPAGLADRVLEVANVEELAMCVWALQTPERLRRSPRDERDVSLSQRIWGRLVQRHEEELRSVIDAWARDRARHLEDEDALIAADWLIPRCWGVAIYGGRVPSALESLLVAVIESPIECRVRRVDRLAAMVVRTLALLPADRRRALRERLSPELLERVDHWLAIAQSEEGRLPVPPLDPDERRDSDLGPLVFRD